MGTKGPGAVSKGLVASKWSPKLHFQADLAIFLHICKYNINGKVNIDVTVNLSKFVPPRWEILNPPLRWTWPMAEAPT